ncbi:MAG: hypothetical protein V4864_20560 [Pseudomonadota bacterium]
MKHRRAVLLVLSAIALAGGAAAATPEGVLGEYRSAPRRVCVPGSPGGAAACSRSTDVLRIARTGYDAMRDVKVSAQFTLPDAQYCPFEGTGYWDARSRAVVAVDASTGCEMNFAVRGRALQGVVLRADQCRSPCAGRNWLEGVLLQRHR